MHSRTIGLFILTGLFCGGNLAAQSFQQDISLSGLGNGDASRPFGITFEANSGRLYVPIAGSIGTGNNVVAVIDPATKIVMADFVVGLFPEDVAFAYDGGGGLICGAVTNSSDGTVSVFDAAHSILATVTIPDTQGFGSFPFGITASENDALFYVTTQDGSGNIFAIDTATYLLDAAAAFNIGPRTGGRLITESGRIFIPDSEFNSSFDGSSGGLTAWDPVAGSFDWHHVLARRSGQFIYPAGQDVVRLPNGNLVLGGTFFEGRLYVIRPDGELLRTIPLSVPGGGAQGLALSADGSLLAVCDLGGDSLALVDMLNFVELSVTNLTQVGLGYTQPNDAVFVGGELFVTCQGSEEVVVFDGLPVVTPGPGYAGSIDLSDTTPDRGASVTVTVSGPGLVALTVAFGDQPGGFMGASLDIGPNPKLLGYAPGTFARTLAVPGQAAALGKNVFFQGVVDVRNTRAVTTPRVAVIQ